MAETKTLLTVREAARLAQVSVRTIDRWITRGVVRAVRPSRAARCRLVPAEDVDPHQYIRQAP